MYESEVNSAVPTSEQLPAELVRAFESAKPELRLRTVLPWSEHCTECVWPTCYSTCDLYQARPDGRCRRFAEGMQRVDLPAATNPYLLKIRFKRWAKLWTPGNIHLHSVNNAARIERRDQSIGRVLQRFPLPSLIQIAAMRKRYGYKKRVAAAAQSGRELPDCFLLECYNPESRNVPLSVIMRPTGDIERSKMPFQKLLPLAPGFHRFRISREEIASVLDLQRPFDIELVPNDEAGETTLYFGMMDFVAEAAIAPEQVKQKPSGRDEQDKQDQDKDKKDKKVKCVVWDLDNTVWDGVLVEDGIEKLRLKRGVADVIQELDARGILNSIASKNNPQEALEALQRFQLDQYFLYPQISWQPKSQAIQVIAKQLNIGRDSLLFIDDSSFEREEVKSVCPEVRTLNAAEYLSLPQRTDCLVPVSAESKERRKLYQLEMNRQTAADGFGGDYLAFLRNCEIRLRIQPMTEANLERVHELTQRTNQMNFSGNRYDREVLRNILSDPYLDTFVLSCEDRFGSYGVIGFSLVERRGPRMTDLMFSCRIQSKRVEHAFLGATIRRYIAASGKDFYANYRKTDRNAPSGQVFADLGMEEMESHEGVLSLRFPKGRGVPDDNVIEVLVEAAAAHRQPEPLEVTRA